VSQLRDAYAEFRRLNTEVATVSVDSPYAHREWAKQLEVPFPMLCDSKRALFHAYDVPLIDLPYFGTITGYHAFVVDGQGVLCFVWYQPEKAALVPIDSVLEAVRAIPEPVEAL
jgi:peroxiredoxin